VDVGTTKPPLLNEIKDDHDLFEHADLWKEVIEKGNRKDTRIIDVAYDEFVQIRKDVSGYPKPVDGRLSQKDCMKAANGRYDDISAGTLPCLRLRRCRIRAVMFKCLHTCFIPRKCALAGHSLSLNINKYIHAQTHT
jgi:hypothetical protein